jgi:hypothetical protein
MLDFLKIKPPEFQPQGSLKYILHKTMAGTQEGRDLGTLHASDFVDKDFCPRRRLIKRLMGKVLTPDQHLKTSNQMVFALGHAVADIVVGQAALAGIAIGDWKCCGCGETYRMVHKPDLCGDCKATMFIHRERRFVSQLSGISCGIDLLVSTLGPKWKIIEIKSMGQEDFRKLVAPLGGHRVRTNLYMRIIEESTDDNRHMIDTENAIVLYVDKGGFGIKCPDVATWKFGDNGFSPFKEFHVKRDNSDTDLYVKLAQEYREAVQTKTICTGICTSQSDGPAKACIVRQQCFSTVFPVGGKFA